MRVWLLTAHSELSGGVGKRCVHTFVYGALELPYTQLDGACSHDHDGMTHIHSK